MLKLLPLLLAILLVKAGADITCPTTCGYHPDPLDCGAFYQCSNWIPYRFECPLGLHFNADTTRCDYPKNAGCEESTFEQRHGKGKHHHRRRRSSEERHQERVPKFHYNHYRRGPISSSYTAINGAVAPPRPPTTPIKSCGAPTPIANCTPKPQRKRIELVIKQGTTYDRRPTYQPRPAQPCYAPIYQQPMPAREYEYYEPPPPPPPPPPPEQRRVSFAKNTTVSEGTGTSMVAITNSRKVSEGTDTNVAGTSMGTSMIMRSGPHADHELTIIKRSELKPEEYGSEPTVFEEEKRTDLCPLCHKGWYVRKFTWSGIVAAIFCFPCGLLCCYKWRVNVCSFCGEEPEAEYKDYKESDQRKAEPPENSRSRVIPPDQARSHWNSSPHTVADDENSPSRNSYKIK